MKKVYTVVLMVFCLIFSGCEKSTPPPNAVQNETPTVSSVQKEELAETAEPEATPLPTEVEKEPESEEYNYINDFIEKFNSTATNAITNITTIDVTDFNGGHFHKEIAHTYLREGVKAKYGYIGNNDIEIISYSYFPIQNTVDYAIMLTCNAFSKEDFERIISESARILDGTLTDDDITKLIHDINKFSSGSHLNAGKIKVKYEKDNPAFWFEMDTVYASEQAN